jgi:hypothetical protein
MFIGCEKCEERGFCDEHPRVTCAECGLTYTDDSDWSGPAHSQDDCIRELQAKLWKSRKAERDGG